MANIVHDEIVQAGLENRHFSGLQSLDFFRIGVDTDDRMSEIRKTRSRDKPYVTRPDHSDMHLLPPKHATDNVAAAITRLRQSWHLCRKWSHAGMSFIDHI